MRHGLERADAAEESNSKLDASLHAEKRLRVEEAIAAKQTLDHSLQMAISKERNEQLSKFADVERSHSKRLSDEQREIELKQQDQKKKHDEHIQMMLREAVKWREMTCG